MKKLLLYIALSLFAASSFAKTTGYMMRGNGPLREDKGNGGVEWSLAVPAGTELTVESEEPVLLTLITEKEKFDNIKFYKVNYEKKTYYARESEVALGKKLTVILSDTTLFTKPALSSFLNAQIEQASIVVAGEKTTYSQSDFTEIQYWSDSANAIRKRYVLSDRLSDNQNDLEAVRTVDVALSVKNKDAAKEKAMKEELFKNAKKLNTSEEITEYVQAKYDKIFGTVDLKMPYSGKIKTADGSKVNARLEPDGRIAEQLENGFYIWNFLKRSKAKSTYDGITDYWYCYYPSETTSSQWVFGGYIEWEDGKIPEDSSEKAE